MLRIRESSENGHILRLRLDGTLTTGSYAELEAAFSQHQGNGEKIILLDMAGVVFMNDEVARKLADLRGARLRIVNCSPFIEALLNTVQS
jgi:anti-anti-sigma regulatory factor